MKYLISAVAWFIGGSFSMIALIGSVIESFEPHHPALEAGTLALMGFTALGYIMCGINFRKWQEDRQTNQGIRKCIEGAKHGWRDPDRLATATHPRTHMQGPADEPVDFSTIAKGIES